MVAPQGEARCCRRCRRSQQSTSRNARVASRCYGPLPPPRGPQGGWLSGKVKRDGSGLEGSRISWAEATGSKMQSAPGLSAFKDDERVWALLDALAAIAAAHDATVAQAALRWVLQKRGVTSIVIGVKSVAQLADNLGALKFALSDAEMARLDECSDIGKPYPYEMVWRVQAGRTRTAATTTAAGAGLPAAAAAGAGAGASSTAAAAPAPAGGSK